MQKIVIYIGLGLVGLGLVITILWKLGLQPKANPENIKQLVGMSIQEAINSRGDFWCNLENKSGQEKGILYAGGRSFRADFMIGNQDGSHLAFDGDWYYIWSSNSLPFKIRSGMVMRDGATQSAAQAIKAAVAEETNKVMCLTWKKDDTMIKPPSGMEFADVSDRMKDTGSASKSAIKEIN